jgi:hypothetical protein
MPASTTNRRRAKRYWMALTRSDFRAHMFVRGRKVYYYLGNSTIMTGRALISESLQGLVRQLRERHAGNMMVVELVPPPRNMFLAFISNDEAFDVRIHKTAHVSAGSNLSIEDVNLIPVFNDRDLFPESNEPVAGPDQPPPLRLRGGRL